MFTIDESFPETVKEIVVGILLLNSSIKYEYGREQKSVMTRL